MDLLALPDADMKSQPELTKRQIRRLALLADVAEMYFVKKLTQKQISDRVETTPSNVSRMIADAERLGVVQVTINRPMSIDYDLADELKSCLPLAEARVVIADDRDALHLSRQVALAGAKLLRELLRPGMTIGVTWGRTLLAIIDLFGDPMEINGKVIQLAGSIGAVDRSFDSVNLVQRLATLTRSRPIHLNAPFVVETPQVADMLRHNVSNRQNHELASACDAIVVGVGSVDRAQSSLFASGFLSPIEINEILEAGAVGEVCGLPIDEQGKLVAPDFSARTVTLNLEDLRETRIKIAVAAREHLAKPLLAATRAGYVSHLVVDVATAKEVLSYAKT